MCLIAGAYKIDHRAWHVTVPDPYREHFGVNAEAGSRLLTPGAVACRLPASFYSCVSWRDRGTQAVRSGFAPPNRAEGGLRCVGCTIFDVPVRTGEPSDAAFIVEMARLASAIEGRPLAPGRRSRAGAGPSPSPDTSVLALDHDGHPVGAAWWHFREPLLVVTPDGAPVPELVVAVMPADRGRGVGRGRSASARSTDLFDANARPGVTLPPRQVIRAGHRAIPCRRVWRCAAGHAAFSLPLHPLILITLGLVRHPVGLVQPDRAAARGQPSTPPPADLRQLCFRAVVW